MVTEGQYLEGNWLYFHRNANPVVHLNEQHFKFGKRVCPVCIAEADGRAHHCPFSVSGYTTAVYANEDGELCSSVKECEAVAEYNCPYCGATACDEHLAKLDPKAR